MQITIYGKDDCQFCIAVTNYFTVKAIPYTYLKLGVDFEVEDLLAIAPNAQTFPQVVIDGNVIGGYESTKQYFANLS